MNPNIDVNSEARLSRRPLALVCAALIFGSIWPAWAEPPRVDPSLYRVVTEIEGLERPWSLAFLPDDTLVLSLGDGFDRREDAQNPSNTLGKIVRLNRDGSIPPDNPLVHRPGTAPEVLTLGHRNVQGIALDPTDGSLLITEHGPRGGDELNRLVPGGNYGWPLASGGVDYSFARVTPFASLPGFEAPLLEWTPSIASAGLAVYEGRLFPQWRGALLVPALVEKAVRLVHRRDGGITGQELLLAEFGERMRDVRVAPDGSIQVLTDGTDGRLLRLLPPS